MKVKEKKKRKEKRQLACLLSLVWAWVEQLGHHMKAAQDIDKATYEVLCTVLEPCCRKDVKIKVAKTKSRFLTVFSKKERLGRLRLCPWSLEHWGMTLETIVKSWGADKVNSHCLYLSVESQTLEVYAERGKIFKRPEGGTFSHK